MKSVLISSARLAIVLAPLAFASGTTPAAAAMPVPMAAASIAVAAPLDAVESVQYWRHRRWERRRHWRYCRYHGC